MNLLRKIVAVVFLFNVSNFAFSDAACPDNLNADEMYDCIVVEGAGGNYLDEKEAELATDAQQDTNVASESETKSKVISVSSK